MAITSPTRQSVLGESPFCRLTRGSVTSVKAIESILCAVM
jgi:hypothetical protein